MPSDDRVAIRLSLSVERNHIGSVSWQSARRPLAADSNTGKYLRECGREIRVLDKQETRRSGAVADGLFVILTPPRRKTRRREHARISRSRRFVFREFLIPRRTITFLSPRRSS